MNHKIVYKFFYQNGFVTSIEFLNMNEGKFKNFNDAKKCFDIAKCQFFAIKEGLHDDLVYYDGEETYIFLEEWKLRWYYYYCSNTCLFYKIK